MAKRDDLTRMFVHRNFKKMIKINATKMDKSIVDYTRELAFKMKQGKRGDEIDIF